MSGHSYTGTPEQQQFTMRSSVLTSI